MLGPSIQAPALRRAAGGHLPSALPSVALEGRRYYADRILGSGTAGVVLRYCTPEGDDQLAVKVVPRSARAAEDRACRVPETPEVLNQQRLEWPEGAAGSSSCAGWAFYSMPCMAGDALSGGAGDRVSSNAAASRAARMVATVARAVRRLDRLGFRYYDIKPANVMRTPQDAFVLGDLGSVASTASTYPAPNSLQRVFAEYHHVAGIVARGERAYQVNCVWAIVVSFLILALPGRRVSLKGRERSVSAVFAFTASHVRDRSSPVAKYAVRLLDEVPGTAAAYLGGMVAALLEGRLEFRRALARIARMG